MNLNPEQVQPQERWDVENWCKILDQIIIRLGASLSPEIEIVKERDIIIAILALLRKLGIEARESV